jgi:hypothetical protein
MNTLQKILIGFLSLTLLAAAGCVSYRETKHTDVKRAEVTFASDKAARIFYEAFNAVGDVGRKTERQTCTLLFFTYTKTGLGQGQNVLFNEAVRFCDTNGDHVITEAEAELFARSWSGETGKT